MKLIFSTPVALTTRLAGNQEHLGVLEMGWGPPRSLIGRSTNTGRFKLRPHVAKHRLQLSMEGSGRIWLLLGSPSDCREAKVFLMGLQPSRSRLFK